MRIRRTALSLAAAAVVLLLVGVPVQAGDGEGKAAFLTHKCDKCHSVQTEDIVRTVESEKMWGPDMSGVGLRRDAEWMTQYVLKEIPGDDGKDHKNTFKGTAKELAAIAAWLVEHKTEVAQD